MQSDMQSQIYTHKNATIDQTGVACNTTHEVANEATHLNKKENVQALLAGKPYAYTPSAFWLHFPKEVNEKGIKSQVQAHVDFARACDLDIVKIMNENEFRRATPVMNPGEWSSIRVLPQTDQHFSAQREILARVLEHIGDSHYTIATVHGLVASLSHSSGYSYTQSPEIMQAHAQENPRAFMDAVKATAENVYHMLELSEESEVDGVYYAALGGEANRFSDEFFETYFKSAEVELLSALQNKKLFLHMCKPDVRLERFMDYPADVVNWAVHENAHKMPDASILFPHAVALGGFDDRSAELVDGAQDDMLKKLASITTSMGDKPFILGADCTLPTDITYERIRFVAQHVRSEI